VQRGTLGTFVYVVNAEDKTVSTRSITLGPNTADTTAVEKGLEPGEQVVVDGADKLRQGARIEFSGAQAPAGTGERKGPRGGDGAPAAVQAEKSEKTEKTEKADTTSAAKPAEAAAPAGKGRE
jgi:multidrug efflux system membrane fusion protein